MSHLSWATAYKLAFNEFWGTNDPGPEEREARAWLAEVDALLRRVPASVTDA